MKGILTMTTSGWRINFKYPWEDFHATRYLKLHSSTSSFPPGYEKDIEGSEVEFDFVNPEFPLDPIKNEFQEAKIIGPVKK